MSLSFGRQSAVRGLDRTPARALRCSDPAFAFRRVRVRPNRCLSATSRGLVRRAPCRCRFQRTRGLTNQQGPTNRTLPRHTDEVALAGRPFVAVRTRG